MAENVFILGAGASAEAGAPLSENFLDRAHELLNRGKFEESSESVEAVLSFLDESEALYSRADIDIDDVEALFTLIDAAGFFGQFGEMKSTSLRNLRNDLAVLIARTIALSMHYPVSADGMVSREYSYSGLATLLKSHIPKNDCSVITMNYDVGLEVALARQSVEVDYGLTESEGLKVLKLHGSINWALYRSKVYPYVLKSYFQKYGWESSGEKKSGILAIDKRLDDVVPEETRTPPGPAIFPPPSIGGVNPSAMKNVWTAAFEEITSATNIYILGYSLPPQDAFFRYLYSIGSFGGSKLRRVWVFNPDVSIEARFRNILGKRVLDHAYRFFPLEFGAAIEEIARGSER